MDQVLSFFLCSFGWDISSSSCRSTTSATTRACRRRVRASRRAATFTARTRAAPVRRAPAPASASTDSARRNAPWNVWRPLSAQTTTPAGTDRLFFFLLRKESPRERAKCLIVPSYHMIRLFCYLKPNKTERKFANKFSHFFRRVHCKPITYP